MRNGIAKCVRLRLLPRSLCSAISFRLVQGFFFRLFDVPTDFSASNAAELLSGSATFLDADLFLFLRFASNKVVQVLTEGVAGVSVTRSSVVIPGEAISSVLLTSGLLIAGFSELTDFRTIEREDFDFMGGLAFGGHISFVWPRGVPLFRFRCEQKWHEYTTLFWVEIFGLLCLLRLAFALFFSIRMVQLYPGWRMDSHLQNDRRIIIHLL